MTLRKGHGARKGSTRIEVLPADELPQPQPVTLPAEAAPLARRENGTIASSEAAKALGARGGKARAENKAILKGLGLVASRVADTHELKPYLAAATAWAEGHLIELAKCGGGYLGPGPQAMVTRAGMLHAASCWASDKAIGDDGSFNITLIDKAKFWTEGFKQLLLAAYELADREGKAHRNMLSAQRNAGANLLDLASNQEREGS